MRPAARRSFARVPHLLSVERRADGDPRRFPFSVPAVRALGRLELRAPVTFFVGENGSGKSTLLEAIAAAAGLPTVGSEDLARDASLGAQRELAASLRLAWRTGRKRGFFLRAEDFFGFTRRVARERAELLVEIDRTTAEYREAGRSEHALGLALGPLHASLAALAASYGEDLDAMSHGQSFLKLFESRFVPGGVHLLDEPEAPLSPHSQLALLAMMAGMVARDAQFVIATHSPIVLAFPGARIVSFDESPPAEVAYDALPHVAVTRDFLAAPERFLRHLL